MIFFILPLYIFYCPFTYYNKKGITDQCNGNVDKLTLECWYQVFVSTWQSRQLDGGGGGGKMCRKNVHLSSLFNKELKKDLLFHLNHYHLSREAKIDSSFLRFSFYVYLIEFRCFLTYQKQLWNLGNYGINV